MAVKLDKMNRKELLDLRDEIDAALVDLDKRERREALEAAKTAAAKFGYSLDELTSKKATKSGAKSAGVAKYRNPDDSSQTWTGKGRQPNWYKSAIAKGIDPSKLEI